MSNMTEYDKEFLPSVCPICKSELKWSGVDLCCENPECGNRNYQDLMHWINTLAPVDGLGDKLIETFLEKFAIESIEDLFDEGEETYRINLDMMEDSATVKKWKELVDGLFVKPIEAAKALEALNIPRLGETSAKKLVGNLTTYGSFKFSGIADLVGQATEQSILENRKKIDRLGFIDKRIVIPSSQSEEMIKVAVTGKLENYKRDDFNDMIKGYGYELCDSLKDCKYLVTNNPDPNSSKGKAAKKYGVEIITESDFVKNVLGKAKEE